MILILGFSGCSSKSTTSRKPVTNIQITPSNKTVIYGNEFSISIESKITKPAISSITVFMNGKRVFQSSESSFDIKIDSDTLLPGQYSIKTEAINSDGKTGINYSTVSIYSDIEPKRLSYRILETYNHNTAYYTEGFEFYNDLLYEGTGNYDESYIYAYDPKSEKIHKSLKNEERYFGEGITILNGKLYQLTYKSKKGFVYDVNTFEKIREFQFYSEEGWGLTNDGRFLIMGDGTSKITYLDPNTFEKIKTIEVSTPKGLVNNINELEYVDGAFYANIWTRETIVKFDDKGRVLEIINMKGLMDNFGNQRVDVMNGIAYNQTENAFYVTGKWWPKMYKVTFE